MYNWPLTTLSRVLLKKKKKHKKQVQHATHIKSEKPSPPKCYPGLSMSLSQTCELAPAVWLLFWTGSCAALCILSADTARTPHLVASIQASGTVLSRCFSPKPGGFPAWGNSVLSFFTSLNVPLCLWPCCKLVGPLQQQQKCRLKVKTFFSFLFCVKCLMMLCLRFGADTKTIAFLMTDLKK